MENTNKIQFNATKYFKNPEGYTLETRGGVKVKKVYNDPEPDIFYKYRYDDGGWNPFISDNGRHYKNRESRQDLFMIPVTKDIPFTLEDFKTGKYDVVSIERGDKEKCLFAAYIEFYTKEIAVIWEHAGAMDYNIDDAAKKLLLRPRPITPYTHPELYEVSNDKIDWYDVIKYYDFIENDDYPHKCYKSENYTITSKHLRLKDQPTIITQQQADEAIKKIYPNYKNQG